MKNSKAESPSVSGVQDQYSSSVCPGDRDTNCSPKKAESTLAMTGISVTDPAPMFFICTETCTSSPTCGIGVDTFIESGTNVGSGLRSLTLCPLRAIENGCHVLDPPCCESLTLIVQIP